MWIVRLALNRPYTFVVLALLILVLGLTSIATTPTDIFPNMDIPVITVIWTYQGLPAKDMENRVTTFSEFVMAVVNDVKAIDSQTVSGTSVIKITFHPQVHIDTAMSQVGAAVNSIRFRLKQLLRAANARTKDALAQAIAQLLPLLTAEDARAWFRLPFNALQE